VEAGVLARDGGRADRDPPLRAHGNLCGRIVIPYRDGDQIADLRTRRFPGAGYTSLPGSYAGRGAITPLCWETTAANEVVLITEGEFKALAATAAYRAGTLPYPTIGHPGLNYFRQEWATQLVQRGVRVAILAYDRRASRPRDPAGNEQLAPEDLWTIRHGITLTQAGLQVLVLTLPLTPGAAKEDLDGFLLRYGTGALASLLQHTPCSLDAFRAALPPHLWRAAGRI
jgi:hypothetical protein